LYSKRELGKVISQKESEGIRDEEKDVGWRLNSQAKAIGLKMFLKIHPVPLFPRELERNLN
jgi:hypothetical protein